jgi:hypothetical protein
MSEEGRLYEIQHAVSNWLCKPSDSRLFIDASRAIADALGRDILYGDVFQVVNSKLGSQPGHKDPKTVAAVMTMQLHQLQHVTGRLIELVSVSSKDYPHDKRVWDIDIILSKLDGAEGTSKTD